jgi:hypothetical protein
MYVTIFSLSIHLPVIDDSFSKVTLRRYNCYAVNCTYLKYMYMCICIYTYMYSMEIYRYHLSSICLSIYLSVYLSIYTSPQ